MSSLRLETSSESENEESEDFRQEVPKRMKMDNCEPEPDYGVECDEKLTPAQLAWRFVFTFIKRQSISTLMYGFCRFLSVLVCCRLSVVGSYNNENFNFVFHLNIQLYVQEK